MWWIPPSLRQWTPRKCPWPSPRTAVKTIPTIPHLKQSVQSLVLKRTASATEILFFQILMVILQDLILLMAFRLQKFKRRKKEDGVLHVLFDCDIKNLFKACCDMTRYYLSHFFHVHVLSEWTNLMQAAFFLFILYLYALSIIHLVHLKSVQKFALTEITSFYCMHLKWCIPRSVLLIIQIYALYFLIPWSFICSFNKKWNSLFHRG